MTSLQVGQGDGLRIGKVAGSVSITQLSTSDKRWPLVTWVGQGEKQRLIYRDNIYYNLLHNLYHSQVTAT
jgi:hypothetical protein